MRPQALFSREIESRTPHKLQAVSAIFLLSAAAFLLSAAALYRPVVASLWREWWTNPDYSHAFLVVPIAAYFAWRRRVDLERAQQSPSAAGLVVVILSLSLLIVGTLGAELFLTRMSLVAFAVGALAFLFGWRHVRLLLFPLALLLLTIPIPAIVISRFTLSLQLIASQMAEGILGTLRIPVLRQGNVLVLPNATLQVAEACSGIRSLIALVTLALVVAHVSRARLTTRALIVASAIPIAVVVNGLRVAASAIAASWYGAAAVDGAVHELMGGLMFLVALGLMAACARAADGLMPSPVVAPE